MGRMPLLTIAAVKISSIFSDERGSYSTACASSIRSVRLFVNVNAEEGSNVPICDDQPLELEEALAPLMVVTVIEPRSERNTSSCTQVSPRSVKLAT